MSDWSRRQGGRLLRACLFAFMLFPAELPAQAVGRIVDTFREPIADVRVELWGLDGRIASTTTNSNGYFSFARGGLPRSTGIVARRLGYRPLTATFGDSATNRTYAMERLAASLPTVVSNASRNACPNVENPNARLTWAAIRRRYFQPSYSNGWTIWAIADSGYVEAGNVGQVDESALRATGIGIGGAQRLADSARFADSGYAYRYYQNVSGRPRPRWAYPMLHSYMVQHFLDPLFGGRHTLSWAVEPESGGVWVMIFCPKRTRLPSISGTLTIGADSSLTSAAWHFHTPEPDEHAGGMVTFAPSRSTESKPVLLPAMSVVWRRGSGFNRDYFYQVAKRYERIHLNYRDPPNPSDPVVKPDSANR